MNELNESKPKFAKVKEGKILHMVKLHTVTVIFPKWPLPILTKIRVYMAIRIIFQFQLPGAYRVKRTELVRQKFFSANLTYFQASKSIY